MLNEMPESWKILDSFRVPLSAAGTAVTLRVGQYENERVAIQAIDEQDGYPYCTFTVNMANAPCGSDQFYAKTGDVEEEIAKFLEKIGLIHSTNIFAPSEFDEHYARLWEIAKLTPEGRADILGNQLKVRIDALRSAGVNVIDDEQYREMVRTLDNGDSIEFFFVGAKADENNVTVYLTGPQHLVIPKGWFTSEPSAKPDFSNPQIVDCGTALQLGKEFEVGHDSILHDFSNEQWQRLDAARKTFKPTPEQIVAVAERHIERYRNRITAGLAGARGIRVNECQMYLSIWQSIKDKGGKNLNVPEANEVQDAILDDEFEEFQS